MLTSLRIQNFKAWRDTEEIRLAPLTVFFGGNSAGKSSIGHLLLALKQTALSTDRHRALHLGDGKSLIDLGTFEDCLLNHDTEQALRFTLEWTLSETLSVMNPLKKEMDVFVGDMLSLTVELGADKTGQPEVTLMEYILWSSEEEEKNDDDALKILFKKSKTRFSLTSENYSLTRSKGAPWPLDAPEKFYRISDKSRSRFQNAAFLSDFALATEDMLARFFYLGPLREHPKRIYQWAGDTPEDVGFKGEYAIPALLAAKSKGRKLNRGATGRYHMFDEFIAAWLTDLKLIHGFSVKPLAEGRKEYEVLIKTHASASDVALTDVGFGVSQVLPALVETFYCPAGSIVWMEQPEIHLHPQVQAELADVFISGIQAREEGKPRGVQLIVESHSEHFLNRLQRRVAEEKISPDDVAIYFCSNGGSGAELELLELNEEGEIENWPENFFGDEMGDLTARTVAAMNKRMRG